MTAHIAGEVSENGSSPATSQSFSEYAALADEEPDPTGSETCPYPGLAFFRQSEARWFFGREQTTKAVISQLGSQLAGGGPLVVMAPSGAGKSSLLAAGVIPALADGELPGSQDWRVIVITPGAHPLALLSVRVAERIGADSEEAIAAADDPERFTAFLTAHAGKQGQGTSSSPRIVLIVDQFEEVFTECQQEPERHAFIGALCAAAQSGTVLVLLGVRADFYGSCLKFSGLVTSLQSPVALGPMSDDQLRSIITGPAEAENLEIEQALVELLLQDLGLAHDPSAAAAGYDPSALPLLAHALRATWQECNGRQLTVAGYRRAGGIREAITMTAESAYRRLEQPEQQIAKQLLLRLVNVSEHTRALRRRMPRERLVQALPASAETSEKILETFGRARLLTLDITSVEITHEALLWAWPRLAKWINADRHGLGIRQMLSEAAEAWEDEGRDSSQLYRGSRLAIAQDLATDPGFKAQLSELEADYLQSSIDHIQHEQQVKQRHQLAQQRHTRNLRVLTVVLAIALVLSIVAVGVAFIYYRQAKKAREDAISGELAADSYTGAAAHPEVAMLRAVEAFGRRQDPKTLSALFSAQSLYFAGQFSGHKDSINTAVFSPDGNRLVTTSDDGTVRLWNATDRHLIDMLINSPDNPAYDARFSADGRTLATIRRDGSVQLWNAVNHQLVSTIDTLPDTTGDTFREATSVAFSPDGLILATISSDKAQLWDVDSRQRIASLPDSVRKIMFNPVNRTVATVSSDGIGRLMSLANPANPTLLSELAVAPFVSSAVFSPDGNILVTANSDRTASLWDIHDPRSPKLQGAPLVGHTLAIKSTTFSPDGTTLVTGSEDGTARLWNVATQKTIATFGGHNGPAINDVSFSRDGNTVVTAHGDGIARLWDKHGPILIPSPPVEDRDSKVKFSPDGKKLAIYGLGGLWLWDMVARSQITALGGPALDVAFSADGRILVIARGDETVVLWDTVKRNQIAALPVRMRNLGKVALSSDGKISAIASDIDKTLQLWNVENLNAPVTLGPPLKLPGNGLFNGMIFSLNDRTLAVATLDGLVSLVDVRKPRTPVLGESLKNSSSFLRGGESFINKMSFSHNDGILIIARGKKGIVERWDVETGHLMSSQTIRPDFPGADVYSVGLGSGGAKLASIDEDNAKIKLWDLGEQRTELARSPMVTLTGHTDRVSDADFSRDERFLATVSRDGTVRIWDLDPTRVTNRLCRIIGTVSDEERTMLISAQLSSAPVCQR